MGIQNFTDKVLGKGEYADAQETHDNLNSKGKRTSKEGKELDDANELLESRRGFLRGSAIVGTALVLGGAGYAGRDQLGCNGEEKKPEGGPSDPGYTGPRRPDPVDIGQSVEQTGYLSERETRRQIDEGFDHVMRNVPDRYKNPENMPMTALSNLKGFREKYIKWAGLRGNTIVSLEKGKKGGGWMVVIPEGHPKMQTQKAAFSLATGNRTATPLFIKPARMTKEWAGIGLTHEMSHFFDLISGYEPKNPSKQQYLAGEARAYHVERALINHLTKGAYSRKVKEIIEKNNIQSVADIKAFFRQPGDSFKELNDLITKEAAKSGNEKGIRNGFHIFGLALGLVEEQVRDKRQEMPAFMKIIDQVMSGSNHRGNLPTR